MYSNAWSADVARVSPLGGVSNIWEALAESVELHRDRPALQLGRETWTYAELWRRADRLRVWLSSELSHGPVLFAPANTPCSVAAILGAIAARRVPVLTDPTWTLAELSKVVERCGVCAVLQQPGTTHAPGFTTLSSAEDGFLLHVVTKEGLTIDNVTPLEGTAFCRFTSGTTGFSRCLEFTEAAALHAARAWQKAAEITADDRVLCLATLNNGLAFNTSLLSVLLTGAKLIFHRGPLIPSSIRRTMSHACPSILVAFPFVYEQLLGNSTQPLAVASLRSAVSSAAPLLERVAAGWRARTAVPICNYYGLVEVGPCTFNDDTLPGSVGKPLLGVDFCVVNRDGTACASGEQGLIRVKSSAMASRYLDRGGPQFVSKCDERGYYVTEDVGLFDGAGYLFLKSRLGRVMNIEGRKVDPSEVERLLRDIPGVLDAVVRAEHAETRDIIAAYVESKTTLKSTIIDQCVSHLAPYKRPQRIIVVEKLPRSATGKVMLSQLPQDS